MKEIRNWQGVEEIRNTEAVSKKFKDGFLLLFFLVDSEIEWESGKR